jgi:hypothetical protein
MFHHSCNDFPCFSLHDWLSYGEVDVLHATERGVCSLHLTVCAQHRTTPKHTQIRDSSYICNKFEKQNNAGDLKTKFTQTSVNSQLQEDCDSKVKEFKTKIQHSVRQLAFIAYKVSIALPLLFLRDFSATFCRFLVDGAGKIVYNMRKLAESAKSTSQRPL